MTLAETRKMLQLCPSFFLIHERYDQGIRWKDN